VGNGIAIAVKPAESLLSMLLVRLRTNCKINDREGQESRKTFKPKDNATDMAVTLGIELLTEEQYRELQKLGNFDTKTSSWVKTSSDIRKLGGALC